MIALCLLLGTADTVVWHARIVSAADSQERSEALAVTGGRLTFVGSDRDAQAWMGPKTQVIDAGGAVIVPGFVDAHAHLSGLGRELEMLDLSGCKSAAELVERVRRRSASNGWIIGRGWDQNDWPDKRFPTHVELSAATPATPVFLRRVDGHAVLVNKKALALAGIDKRTADPPGGRIARDATGEPTGVLIDTAEALVAKWLPEPTDADIERALLAGQAAALAVGLVGVHDMGVSAAELRIYRALERQGKLALRIYAALDASDDALLEAELATGPQVGEWLTVRAIKAYADGALGSRGAALLAPYRDDPSQRGLFITPYDALLRLAERARRAGFQLATHAIGDAANRMVLDVYARVRGERFRVEHAQVVDAQDWPRFASLGVIASVQPTHATSDMDWAEARLGKERLRGAYAWRSLLRSGARLAFGSDFPVERPSPLAGLHAAVMRGGWRREEALTPAEALAAFTTGARYAAFEERDAGMLRPGMRADFVLLDSDPLTQPPSSLHTIKVLATFTAGVKRAPSLGW